MRDEKTVMATRGADASVMALEIGPTGCPVHAASAHATAAPGFRHFLGTPRASQRFRAFGVDPLESPAHLPEIRALMNRLSRRMDAEVQWPPHGAGSLEHWENPSIPSGYTYLL